MDQLKEILRQAIKYRFWIAVGVSALLPLIAYFVGSGPIQAKAKTETDKILGADKDVAQYASGTPVNRDYKPLVDEKTGVLTVDVNNTWQKLYDRQKNLLMWPERVHERFTKWGRAWPDPAVADASLVHATIIDYIEAYPDTVTAVYKTCNPFDPVEGTGVVSAPPEAQLLAPATFDSSKPPSLGKVWAAQERLWVQKALLSVVAEVNKGAKDWNGAIIKQINLLTVGAPSAQDQQSLAKGEAVAKAEDVVDPNLPVAETAEGGDMMGGPGGEMSAMYSAYGGGMGGGMGGPAGQTEDVYYITTDSTQFKIMPVQLTVLVEQGRIQDLLVALENSPMSVQVKDFEMGKPATRVTKPEKGQNMMMGYGMMGMGMDGMGGMAAYMEQMGGYGGNYGRMQSMMGMMGMMGPGSEYMGGMGGMGAAPQRKGVDTRSQDIAKKRKEQEEAVKKFIAASAHDPYYDIAEVTIYGQARFFNPPPAEESAEPSQSESAGAEAAPAAATPPAEAPKEEPAKAEAPKEEPAKAEAPKEEPAKAEAPKEEPAKAEAPKP